MTQVAPPLRRVFPAEAVLHDVRLGRGYGVTVAKVIDLGCIGTSGRSLHVLDRDDRPLCRTRGALRNVERSVDAHAERVGARPVCVTCRDLLPPVPMPRLLREEES